MTDLRCDVCGRALATETAFCPYCGTDRRPAATPVAVSGLTAEPPAPSPPPDPPTPTPDATAAITPEPGETGASEPSAAPLPAAASRPGRVKPPRRGGGCGLRLLLALMVAAALLAWCAVHAGDAGPPRVPGATAVAPLRVTRRWRTTGLPGDAPASARFAVSSDTALRVRTNGRVYAVRPGHPLRLPEDLGDSFDVRAADYVTPDQAAHAKATLSTLRGG